VLSVYEASAPESAADHLRNRERTWWILYASVVGVTLLLGALALETSPRLVPQTLVLLGLGGVVALARPLAGLHLVTFFTLLGDASILPEYPFAKNLSSRESVFFIDDATTLSPLELMLVATTLGLLLHAYVTPGWRFRRGALLSPFLVLGGLVVVGVLRAFFTGGNTNVALWEARPLLYLPLVYLLVTNLVTTPRQMFRLLMVAMAGVAANSLITLNSYRMMSSVQREAIESLNEHSASVHIGALFILTLALWLFRAPLSLRVAFTALTALSLPTFLFSERRGAVVGLGAGLILFFMVLFARSRRTFYVAVPILLILLGAYVGAFWGAEEGAVSFPAQAIKGVIAPGEISEQDAASNLYRDIEGFNLQYTMRAEPLAGVGFGKPFYRPAPMPDISFFVFWQYVPHNSLFWVWLKTGVLGFIALLYLFGRAIQEGIRSVLVSRSPERSAFICLGLAYVVMFAVFAYVDIAWDARSAVFLALALAACADFPRERSELAPDGTMVEALEGDLAHR
jgi:hypothetical protein